MITLFVALLYLYVRYPFHQYLNTWWAWPVWLIGLLLLIGIIPVVGAPLKHQLRGEEGEQDVADILDELPESYIYLSNINLEGKGNIDYVLMGPPGIWTIEVKSHAGNITFNGAELERDGELLEKDFLKQAWAEAYSVKDLLKNKLGRYLEVRSVIVFSDPDTEMKFGLNPIKGVYIINSVWLRKLVLQGRNILGKEEIDKISGAIKEANIKD